MEQDSPVSDPTPLLTVRLRGGVVHLPFSMATLLAARDGLSDDPKVQGFLYVNFMQSVWRDWRRSDQSVRGPRASIGQPPADVPWALHCLRDAAAEDGMSGLDFTHLAPTQDAVGWAETFPKAMLDAGMVAMAFDDGSTVLFDATRDLFTAWASPRDIQDGLDAYHTSTASAATALRDEGNYSFDAYWARLHVEGRRLSPRFLPPRVNAQRLALAAERLDPRMRREARENLMALAIYTFPDGSSLVYDPALRQWCSAFNAAMFERILEARYAPKRMARAQRKLMVGWV
jgi:hypothetical protein